MADAVTMLFVILIIIYVVVQMLGRFEQYMAEDIQIDRPNVSNVNDTQNDRRNVSNVNESKIQLIKERRIVLLGKTGKGKSATGNSILGQTAFTSMISGGSVTTRCRKKSLSRFNLDLIVVDTPGLFDTSRKFIEIALDLFNCIHLSTPGPHVFLIVLDISRFTEEENEAVNLLRIVLGERFLEYTIILFTHQDEMARQNITPHDFIKTNPNLGALIEACGNRYDAFNNLATGVENHLQVGRLLDKINNMTSNGMKYCNTKAWKIHEKVLREKAHIFEDHKSMMEQCKHYLHEVKLELTKMKEEEKRQFITKMMTGVLIAGGTTAVCGLDATVPATLAYVVGKVLSKRKAL